MEEKFGLLYQKYLKAMRPFLKDAALSQEAFFAFAKDELEGTILIENKPGQPQAGFLFYRLTAAEVTFCQVPLIGYYADSEKAMSRLFQKLGEAVVHQNICDFSFHLYHKDQPCLDALHLMQFGTMSETCLAKLQPQSFNHEEAIEIRPLAKEELNRRWDEVWNCVSQIIEHLQKSPIFYPGKEFTEEVYRDYFFAADLEVIGAFVQNRLVGLIEWNPETNPLVDPTVRSVNVGEIYVEPVYRKTGLAQRLLEYAKACAMSFGAQIMWVQHGTANPNARGFWNAAFVSYEYELVRTVDGRNL